MNNEINNVTGELPCGFKVLYGDDDDICQLLGMSKSRLRAKLSANEPLPPRIQIPESRVRLWRMSEVYSWINKFETKDEINSSQPNFDRVRKSGMSS